MKLPGRTKLKDLFHAKKEENPFEGQEKRLGRILEKSLSLSNSRKHLEAINEYYEARNFVDGFRAQEPDEKKAVLEVKLTSVHKRIFEEISKEIDLCCAGDRYDKAMYLYELLREFHEKSEKYLKDEQLQDFFKRMQATYNSMIAIYKLHHPKGVEQHQRS